MENGNIQGNSNTKGCTQICVFVKSERTLYGNNTDSSPSQNFVWVLTAVANKVNARTATN